MTQSIVRAVLSIAVCSGVLVGCSAEKKEAGETEETRRPTNVGDAYLRGTLGAAHSAQIRLGLIAIEKSISMYRMEHGRNPASLEELSQKGMLNPIPQAPPGKRFAYDAATGQVTVADQ